MSKPSNQPRGEPPGENSSTSERVVWVVDTFCDGNRAEMARLLGFSHTAINKVVAGERKPGRRLLIAISKKMGIPAAWLLTGSGTPFDTPTHASIGDGYAVPISTVLLPGPPAEYRNQLTGEMHVVSGMHAQDTLYVLEVQSSDPILNDPSEAIWPGDRMLLDTDPERWRENVRALDGKLCCVRRHTSLGTELSLARVQYRKDGVARLWTRVRGAVASDTRTCAPEMEGSYGRNRVIVLDPVATDNPRADEDSMPIGIQDVVAVAITLLRYL